MKHQADLSSTPSDVIQFVNEVRLAVEQTHREHMDPKQIQQLQKEYKKLYKKYQKTKFEGLTNDTVMLLEYLNFGLNARLDLQRPVLLAIGKSTDTQYAHTFLQEYIKSATGYHSVHKTNRTSEQKDLLMQLFGGLLGVQITDEFVKSIKAEQLMDVVVYVASGQHANDVVQYRKQAKQDLPIDMYLLSKIQERKHEVVYSCDESEQRQGYNKVAAHVYALNTLQTGVAGRLRSDSCYINHETREIHIGLATSLDDLEKSSQASTIYKIKEALEQTIQAMKDTEGFEFKGYTVHTHLLHGGLMPTETLRQQSSLTARSETGHSTLISMGFNDWSDTQRHEVIEALELFPVLAYTAEATPYQKTMKGLMMSNMASLGMDTHNFYAFCANLRHNLQTQASTPEQVMQSLANKTLDYTDQLLRVLNQQYVSLVLDGEGKGKIETIIRTVARSFFNHAVNFPPSALGGGQYSEEHQARLMKTSNDMALLYDRLNSDFNTSDIKTANEVLAASSLYQTPMSIQRLSKGREVVAQFDEEKYHELSKTALKNDKKRAKKQFSEDMAFLFEQGNTEVFALLHQYAQVEDGVGTVKPFDSVVGYLKREANPRLKDNGERFYKTLSSMAHSLNSFMRKENPSYQDQVWQDILAPVQQFLGGGVDRSEEGRQMMQKHENGESNHQDFVKAVLTHFPTDEYPEFYTDVRKHVQACRLKTPVKKKMK